MNSTEPARRRWRARWAERENERRQRAYQAAVAVWRQRDGELRSMRAAAVEFRGSAEAAVGLPVELLPGEVVYHVLPAVELVETAGRHAAGLPKPQLAVMPVPAADFVPAVPDGIEVVDAGMAVVTDRAVIFLSRDRQSEWEYVHLAGLGHDPIVPFTLLYTVDQRNISGLLVPPAAAAEFRFQLTLAFADALGERSLVVAQLDELIAAHERARPAAPAVVAADQAPLTALASTRRLVVAAVAVAVLAAAAGAVTFGRPGASSPDPAASAGGSTAAGAPAGGTSLPGTVPGASTGTSAGTPTGAGPGTPTGAGLGAGATTPAPGTGQPAAGAPAQAGSPTKVAPSTPDHPDPADRRPASSPTASPTPTDLCGAPPNPYGYNYCGGSLITAPAADVCAYFACVDGFSEGRGYMIQCGDGLVSMMGGRSGACADNRGARRPVYQ